MISNKKCISDIITVLPHNDGFVLIPDKIDWSKDFPILEALNEKHVKITFEDGEEIMFAAGNLYLVGSNKDKIVVTCDYQVVCYSSCCHFDASFDESAVKKDEIVLVDEYVLNEYTLGKLGVGTPLFVTNN